MDYNQIVGYNVRKYREAFNEKQEDLADLLGIGATALSNYELGKRALKFEYLVFIANRYGTTIDSFFVKPDECEKETKTEKIKVSVKTKDFIDYVKTSYPITVSEDALKDEIFRNSYYKHKDMYSNLNITSPIPVEIATECYEMYKESLEKNKTIEAAANIVSIILFISSNLQNYDPQALEKQLKTFGTVTDIKNFVCKPRKDQKELLDIKKEFIIENIAEVYACIARLKKSDLWWDLGDYYFALSIHLGFSIYDNSQGLNMKIARDIMRFHDMIGNKYCKDFLHFL